MTEIMTLHQPSGWKLCRLGQLFDERKEKVSDKDYPPLSVTMNGIVPQLESAAKTDDGDNRKLVKIGDYVINSRSDRKGSGGISAHDGSVSLISIVLKPKGIHPTFAHHLLRSQAFQEEFYRWGHGIVADLWTTRFADMKNIRLFLPDISMQKAIADFLDREIVRIDQLIAKKQRFLSVSTDYWETFTFNEFTGGNLPLAGKQPTGRGFIPHIPKHWTLKKLKYISPGVTVGIVVTPAAYYVSDGVPALRATNIRPMAIRSGDMVFISDEGHRINKKSKINADDVVAVRTGQPGTSAVVPDYLDGANCIDLILIRRSKIYNSKLLSYFMNSASAKSQYTQGSSGAIQQHFNVSVASNLLIPTPPLAEQAVLLDRLDRERARLDKIETATGHSIDRLREFRTALITAAVTGQIDVAEWGKHGEVDRQLDEIQEALRA